MYCPVETLVTPLTRLRRERLLPAPGEVLVHPGARVEPADVVARCQLQSAGPDRRRLWVVDVSQSLGVRRERTTGYLRKAIGDPVQAGEVLAQRSGPFGWLKRSCRAPVDGRVVAVRSGRILIDASATTFELCAHIEGRITGIIPERGVVISAVGALIQGVWGSVGGKSPSRAHGELKVVVDNAEEPLHAEVLGADCRGTLVVAGRILDTSALEQAAKVEIQGLIVGSVNADLCELLRSLPYPVLVTERFGTLSMSRQAFSLLQYCTGRQAMLSAENPAGWATPVASESWRDASRRDVAEPPERPEVFVPFELEGVLPPEEPGPQLL